MRNSAAGAKGGDGLNSIIYCDPPYYQTEGYYEVVFIKEDHYRLRDTLAGCQGKWLVSYNDCEFIRELYKDFNIKAVSRINNLAQRYDNGCEYRAGGSDPLFTWYMSRGDRGQA